MLLIAPASARPGDETLTTSRVFAVPVGRVTRTFAMRELEGVILLNRITAPVGVHAMIDGRLFGAGFNAAGDYLGRMVVVAGVQVTSWQVTNDPALTCHRAAASQTCTQGEEWCPMPRATWHFTLTKLSGPAGDIRFTYIVAPAPQSG